MFKCPNCGGSMPTNDVNDADWVALGQVVCGPVCHEETYDLMKGANENDRYQLPLRLNPG
jgi:transcription initiation factor TFIIIB Brf1 subunit/transcription initiation factor TFIIB